MRADVALRPQEDYYYSEYTPAEQEQGHHLAASNFVSPLFRPCCTASLLPTLLQNKAGCLPCFDSLRQAPHAWLTVSCRGGLVSLENASW